MVCSEGLQPGLRTPRPPYVVIELTLVSGLQARHERNLPCFDEVPLSVHSHHYEATYFRMNFLYPSSGNDSRICISVPLHSIASWQTPNRRFSPQHGKHASLHEKMVPFCCGPYSIACIISDCLN
jgi:hypothetical protein